MLCKLGVPDVTREDEHINKPPYNRILVKSTELETEINKISYIFAYRIQSMLTCAARRL